MGNLDVPSRMDNRPRSDCEMINQLKHNPLPVETCHSAAPQKPTVGQAMLNLHLDAMVIVEHLDFIEAWITGAKGVQERCTPGDSNLDDQITSTSIRLDEAKQSLERIRMAIVGNENGDRLY